MNPVVKEKLAARGPLTRGDIADVLVAIGKPGELRDEKKKAVQEICQTRRTGVTGGHAIWDTLADFPEY